MITSCVENETGYKPSSYDFKKVLNAVLRQALKDEKCPYKDVSVNLLITDEQGIQDYNKTYRNIDKVTDVLSFPNIEFETPSDFSCIEGNEIDYMDPQNGRLQLGDIVINYKRIISQAEEYGHSEMREFAFLCAHSIFHLCGYDHMEIREAAVMEHKQAAVLDRLGITREIMK
ncbi:MAG: rRNA maturation RNase YbeY [Lachnospiraceae bacterium]|nr:rRNA maturation RNase YbeY [Lachnospiraceae bacterium]